jgi:hypothetical protein
MHSGRVGGYGGNVRVKQEIAMARSDAAKGYARGDPRLVLRGGINGAVRSAGFNKAALGHTEDRLTGSKGERTEPDGDNA